MTNEDTAIALRCLRCGQPKEEVQFVAESHESYPEDGSKLIYVI